MAIRLITFDVTGTLLHFRTPVIQQYASVAAANGITSDLPTLTTNFKINFKKLATEHPNFGKATGIGWYEWWTRLIAHTFDGMLDNNQVLRQVANDLIEHFKTDEAWCVAPGVKELLENLSREGYNLGVISNYDPRLHTLLSNMGIKKYFSIVLLSYEFGFLKPDPRIFQEALKQSAIGNSLNALHIGNDLECDFNGAKSAGWNAALLTENVIDVPHKIRDLVQVPLILKHLNKK